MKESFSAKGGHWVWGQNVMMGLVLLSGPISPGSAVLPMASFLGALLIGTGALVGIAGTRHLGTNRTPYPLPRPHAKLIQDGIYGYVRHPLYTSLMLLGFGWATWWGSLACWLIALAMTLHLRFKATLEERHLRLLFPDYQDYQARVPAFFPRVG